MKPVGKVTDKYFNKQWGLKMLRVPEAWAHTQGEDAVCAVIDSGVDGSHYDLGWSEYINLSAIDSPASIRAKYEPVMRKIRDGSHPKILPGWNFITKDDFTWDHYRHGTYMAGTIGAELDQFGMVGVAPKAKIRPYVVVNKWGRGNSKTVAEAVESAVADGCDVINLSLQFSHHDTWLQEAVRSANRRGIIVVAASGNWNKPKLAYPAAYWEDVIAVGGCDPTGKRWVHSPNRGSNYGEGLRFLCPGSSQTTTRRFRSRFARPDGTSQACAHFSGIACLFKSIDRSIDRARLVEILRKHSEYRDWMSDELGHGVPNVAAAVTEATRLSTPKVIRDAIKELQGVCLDLDAVRIRVGRTAKKLIALSNNINGRI